MAQVVEIASPGTNRRIFRVATFRVDRPGRVPLVSAYSRVYNSDWDGCVLYDVLATDAAAARRCAIAHRRQAAR